MRASSDGPRGWFVNRLGWLSFLGLFAVGAVGLAGGTGAVGAPHPAGAAYLAVGGLAFALVLWLVLRRD